MKFNRIAVLLLAVNFSLFTVPNANAQLIPSPDGLTVYDTILQVNWLANANLAGTPAGRFGVDNIDPGGAMDYSTALQWVQALNNFNGGAGYLGQNNWTLPTTFIHDPTCSAVGPQDNSFGSGCMFSAMGSLFYRSFGLQFPNTAVPIPSGSVGPFTNFQPYLYWSDTISADASQGYHTFSFNTGWVGSNVDKHYMYALPMIPGRLPGTPPPTGSGLQVSPDGQTAYDPVANVTWLTDADLALTEKFGAQCVHPDGFQCINPDGSMTHSTAVNWIAGMNTYNHGAGWLGQTNWQLPPILDFDFTCSIDQRFGFGCRKNPMGELFYGQLGLTQGMPVVTAPNINLDGFNNIQPYLYWSCEAPKPLRTCQGPPPAPGFEWSFSFGNGFQGTDVIANNMYVMVYYPATPAEALNRAITTALGTDSHLKAFLTQAAHIAWAPNNQTKVGNLGAFINHVNAQRGRTLNAAEANQLISLAQAI